MSFPIPSFFKIRCGIIIIAFLLFFMFIGMLKQAFAACSEIPSSHPNGWGIESTVHASLDEAWAACKADHDASGSCQSSEVRYSGTENSLPSLSGWQYYFYDDNMCGPPYKFRMCFYCPSGNPSTCPDSDNDGKPDACDTCPSQTGYKSDVLGLITYCGNTTTQCNGESHTDYEWGFSSDNCTPAQEPDCHVTPDCKRDTDGDGIADDTDSDIDGDGISNANDDDIDGDGIPNNKDVNSDKDGDGQPDPSDPCPGSSDPNCVNPCEGLPPTVCKDTDGDGIKDSEDDDIDGDGIPNANDDDIDGDGDPNTTDTDDDGDGKPDDEDTCPSGKGTSGCDEDGNGTPDELEDTATSPYKSKVDPYSTKEETSSHIGARFGDRFKKFFDDMKATSVFSIPGQIFGDLPTGGSPTFMINGGQTFGTHELNMDSWVPGLAALRAVLYIIAGWGAVKIALLGK